MSFTWKNTVFLKVIDSIQCLLLLWFQRQLFTQLLRIICRFCCLSFPCKTHFVITEITFSLFYAFPSLKNMIRRHLNGFWNFKKAANDTAFKIPISVLKYILVLWTELLMKTGHCREFQKLTFEALAVLQWETIFCSDKGLPTHDMSALETLR